MMVNFNRVLDRLKGRWHELKRRGNGRAVVRQVAHPPQRSASPPGSRTGPQVSGGSGLDVLGGLASLAPQLPAGYQTYRRMRRDPTIALARALAVAPVVAGKWTVQADADVPQEVRNWIGKQFLTVREPLVETILKHGYVDFGHQGFEFVWGLDPGGRQHVARFKPLLPDITEILIDGHGGLAGLRQRNVDLLGASAMLVSFGGEGSNLDGEPLLENVRQVWNDWRKANEVAARYDRKIAGAYLLLHYPGFGQGIDQNGAKLDNVYLAQRILDKLEAASGVAIGDVPSELAPGQDPNQTAWRLEVQGSAGGQQQGFVDRLRYLDSLKVRGMLLPERAILEGQHGTLAESQSQGDLALLQAELIHHHLTREINRQAVDPVLEANWGPAYRGKVRLEAAPLSDANQGFFRQLVTQVLADPKDFADLFHRADWPAIFDAVGLPQVKTSSAATAGATALLSAIGQLQREAMESVEETTCRPLSCPEWYSTAGSPSKDLAVQSQDAHTESAGAGALRLAGFDPNQRRDKYGRWTKDGSGPAGERGAAGETGAPGTTFDLKKVQEYWLNPVSKQSLQAATDKIWKSLGTVDPDGSPVEDNKPEDVFVRFRGSRTFPTEEGMQNKYDAVSGFAWVLDVHLKPVKYDPNTRQATFDTSGTAYRWQPWIISSANLGNPGAMYAVGNERPVPLAAFSQTTREHELWHVYGTKGPQYDDLRAQAAKKGWDLPPHPGFVGELNRRIQETKNKLGNGQITVQLTPAQTNSPDAHGAAGKGPYNPMVARHYAMKMASDELRKGFAPLISNEGQDAISDAGQFHGEMVRSGRSSCIKWIGAKRK